MENIPQPASEPIRSPKIYTKTFADYWNSIDPEDKVAIAQYQEIAGTYDRLWKEIYKRTEYKEWAKDGLGSCHIDEELSEDKIEGFIRMDVIELRHRRNQEAPGYMLRAACPNHRPGYGCVLGDLKSPKCLDHVPWDLREEIEERFGIHIFRIEDALTRVSLAGVNMKEKEWILRPELNEAFTKATVKGLTAIIEYIKTFPVLIPDEKEPNLNELSFAPTRKFVRNKN